ncbi:MAG: hypothetical protein Q9213_002343 [Squamulea squamosa]
MGLVYLATSLVASSVVPAGSILQLPSNATLSLNTTDYQTPNHWLLPSNIDLGGGLTMKLTWTGDFIGSSDLDGFRKDLVEMVEYIMEEPGRLDQFLTRGYYTGEKAVVFCGLVPFDVITKAEAIKVLLGFGVLFNRYKDFRRNLTANITTSRRSTLWVDLQLARQSWQLPFEWHLLDHTNMTIDLYGELAERRHFERIIDCVYFLGQKFISEGNLDRVISRSIYSYDLVTLEVIGPDQDRPLALITRREMHAAMEETQLLFENGLEPRMFKASVRRGGILIGKIFLVGTVQRM